MAVFDELDNNGAELATPDAAESVENEVESFSEGDREAGYVIDFDRSGVFITIYPSEDDRVLFEMDNMQRILDKYRTIDYSIVTLTKAIRKAEGTKVKLSDEFKGDPDAEADDMHRFGNVYVDNGLPYAEYHFEISKDRMSATLKWDMLQGRQIPPVDVVIDEMNRSGIKFGYDDDYMKGILPKGIDFIVAKGREPIKGEDARIERFFDLSQRGKAVSDDHDRVDFKNLQLFVLAKEGDVLARRIPHTLGTPGINVLGDEINAKSGKPRPVPAGKNTRIENENEVVANIDGQIVDSGTTISIDPRFEVSGNVGVSTGNIVFNGSVRVSGDVEMGFSVKATGDIEIGGVVAGGDLEGNNISINGGVQGMSRSKIIAKGNLSASFAENAELEAGGNIHIVDVSLHSTLTAGGKIILEGRRGAITGGLASAGEEVSAQVIGNAANVITRVSVGQNPMLHREYKKLTAELNEAKKKMDSLKKTLKTLEKIDIMSLPEQRIEQINKLTRSQFPLAGEIERKTKQLAQMDEEIVKMKHGRVKVRDTIYPGVRLSINSILKNFQSAQSCCSLYTDGDDIKTGPY